jgi:hypothetical protein
LEPLVITWRELLVVVAIILSVYIAELLLLTRSGEGKVHMPRFFGAIRRRREEHALRKEIEELRQRVAALEVHFPEHEVPDEESASPSTYIRAIQMAKQGHDAETLAAGCGISRSEAELIIAMHGRRAA